MKRGIVVLTLILLLLPLISAEIIINQQPREVYNLGDIITVPTTIKSLTDMTGIFQMDLLCNGQTNNFYKNGVSLASGEEKRMDSSLVLTKQVIGELRGTCKIKAFIGSEFVLTNDFKVSNLIKINTNFEDLKFNPGENILIEGGAVKDNGKNADGFIEFSIIEGNASILNKLETINNGFFSINITFPKDMKAGAYLVKLEAHEVDPLGEITNKGFTNQNIVILQIPKSLEIVFETSEVEPGTNLKVKAVLHDQTGEKIAALSFLTIKNQKDKILEQTEIATDEFLEFPINYNQHPFTWKVVAVSNKLTTESEFTISEKESVEIEIINRTITITNTGNVLYNKTAVVRIGNETINIDVYLDVDKNQKYLLSAPDGEYEVEVITGYESITADLSLTGKTIDVRKASGKIGTLMKYPLVWIFVILILGFITFIAFKRGTPQAFVGRISSKMPKGKKRIKQSAPLEKDSQITSIKKAELSLSIKGDKQNVSVVGLHIKNLKETQSKQGNAKETIQNIASLAEGHKAVIYESQGTLFFIVAPTKTKTFKNEKTALEIAQKAEEILKEYNKTAQQKIHFGISLNHGTIIAKQDADSFKFMSMGTLMATSKKIASMANNEILLSEKINSGLREHIKTIRHEKKGIHVYSIKEIKDAEGNKKFVKSFLERIEGKDHRGEKKEPDKE